VSPLAAFLYYPSLALSPLKILPICPQKCCEVASRKEMDNIENQNRRSRNIRKPESLTIGPILILNAGLAGSGLAETPKPSQRFL